MMKAGRWLTAIGIMFAVLGMLAIIEPAIWAIGTLVGVKVIITGFSRLMLGSAARSSPQRERSRIVLEASRHYFRKTADALELPPLIRDILLTPFRVVKVELVIEADQGDLLHFLGYRVQHNRARGPLKGGCVTTRRSSFAPVALAVDGGLPFVLADGKNLGPTQVVGGRHGIVGVRVGVYTGERHHRQIAREE